MAFIQEYYQMVDELPKEILIQDEIDEEISDFNFSSGLA